MGIATAIVVGDGAVPGRAPLDAAWPGWADGLQLVVGADGGATKAEALGLRPDVVVGDLDSIDGPALDRLRAAGVPVEAWPAQKDASDLELAVRRALELDPARLVILGALGGARLDHALANLLLLCLPELAGRDVSCLDATTRVRVLVGPGRLVLAGRAGDLVTLLPVGGSADGVTTDGLGYPLRDGRLLVGPSRGLSNVRVASEAAVRLERGRLLIVESRVEEVQRS